jgi:diguanylate cyclase (GGDEF)-like protein/PAS domain S-box-containing protein/putative nucleotidyltransferase with HDIG domain
VFEQSEIGVAAVDRDLRCLRANEAFSRCWDRPPSDLVGKTLGDALPAPASEIETAQRHVVETGVPHVGQDVVVGGVGDSEPHSSYRFHHHPILSSDGTVAGVTSIVIELAGSSVAGHSIDDAAPGHSETHLSELEALSRYRTMFEGASAGILRVRADGHIVEANPAMERMLGYTAAELAAMGFREYTHADDVEHNLALFTELMAGERESFQLEKRCFRKDGELVWAQVTAALERDADGLPAFAISMFENITERKIAQEALRRQAEINEHQALHDTLTGLANRRKLYGDVERALAVLPEGATLALGIYDLDGFKAYNDTFGHPAGDALLSRLGRRLAASLDGRGTAYRMGGDEFCVVTYASDAEAALEDARAALSDQGEQFSIRCSRGSAVMPVEAATLERALHLADERLYSDKRAGKMSESMEVRDALVQVIVEQSQDLARHVINVAELAAATAARLGLSPEDVACTRIAAELHDIGKAAIPEAILSKPGPLDPDEWEFIKRHTLIGERIVAAAPALARIAPIVRSSHERADGSGYPDGLGAEAIPLGARIVAVVDAFDAMIAGRPYRPAVPVEEAIAELRRCTGSQFDAAVVQAFVDVIERAENRTRAA